MTYEEIKRRFEDRIEKDNGERFVCRCPGHEDNKASLSVSKGDNGRTILKCFAGCDVTRILDPLGLTVKDLFSNGSAPNKRQPDPVVARYDYHDASGEIIFRVERRQSKKFAQCRPDPANPGQWVYNLKGVRRVLYRLPELLASDPAEWVLLVEGEKDADNLRKAGYTATTNAGGAGKWQNGYNQSLQGRNVCILPDNDEPGRDHALMVGNQLAQHVADLRVLELPDLPAKGDVSDWLNAGNDPTTLAEIVDQAPTFAAWSASYSKPRPEGTQPPPPNKFTRTDLGNARRLVAQHGADLRYSYAWGKWLIWDGVRWAIDETGEIERRAKATVASIYQEASTCTDEDERKAIARWAMRSESKAAIADMIALARSEPGIPVRHTDLDVHPWLLNVRNGTIDLHTGELRPHNRADLLTKLAPVDYDPAATCPGWIVFNDRIFAKDRALIDLG